MEKGNDPYLPAPLERFKDQKMWIGMEVSGDGKKRPINPFTGELASSTDCTTWGTFNEGKKALQWDVSSRYKPQYLAIALSKELGLIVIDLDDVIDPGTKEIEPWANKIVEEMNSYTEISQSGKGIHIYVLGSKTTKACRGEKIEIYDEKRFIMVTKKSFGLERPLREAQKELEIVCEMYLKEKRPHQLIIDEPTLSTPLEDIRIIEKASNAKNGTKFKSLYFDGNLDGYNGDESRADLALIGILAFWTQDEEQLERLFSQSALGQRDKWQDREDYRQRTIKTALDSVSEIYLEPEEGNISHEEVVRACHDNEAGDARLFTKLYGEKYRFDPVEKVFYFWNGRHWEVDRKKQRFEDMKDMAKYYEKIDLKDENQKKELKKRAFALKGNKRLKNVLEMATHGEDGLTYTGEWDKIACLLPCANGLIDLQTGNLLSSSSKLSIRNICPVEYRPAAACPLFDKFMNDIMLGDQEMIEFIQRLAGYMLLGEPIEHIFVVFWGENGRNGKGTFCRIYQKILGSFARTFSPEMILLQRNPPSSGNPRADLVHLQGTRIAIFSEINKKRALDPSQIKNLSGGDVISARALFSNEIRNFTPSHTLLIQTNYKPEAPSEDNALWRRAVLVPFEAEFCPVPSKPHHRIIDVKLEEKLLKEAPGILNRLIQGGLDYQKKGLLLPEKVRAAVETYRGENNGIEVFVRDRCEKVPELSVKCSVFRESVRSFCSEEGYQVPSFPEITQYMTRQGYSKTRLSGGDYWRGLEIRKIEE